MRDVGEFIMSGALPFDAAHTIIEIGAHVGSDSRQLRRFFPNATIYCFEPDPRNTYAFRKAGLDGVVNLVEAAIGDIDGESMMHLSTGAPLKRDPNLPSNLWTYSSSLKKPVEHLKQFPWVKFGAQAKVKVMRLDTFVQARGIERIDFLWADVQGAEDQMIAGGQRALARTRYLYTEYADRELYQGQIPLSEILKRLPGEWEVLGHFPEDVLLRNTAFASPVAGSG